jgi:hypothetical protein
MDVRSLEPRTVMWAVAEITWHDQTGTHNRTTATLEDTSLSGACIRVKTPFPVGSLLTVKWHREQFSAVTRSCRRDGRDFLVGLLREAPASAATAKPSNGSTSPQAPQPAKSEIAIEPPKPAAPSPAPPPAARSPRRASAGKASEQELPESTSVARDSLPEPAAEFAQKRAPATTPAARPRGQREHASRRGTRREAVSDSPVPRSTPAISLVRSTNPVPGVSPQDQSQPEVASSSPERKTMQPKGFFPKFWQRQPEGAPGPTPVRSSEVPVNHSHTNPAESLTGSHTDLLSYDDIYHAAGILSPGSGYSVHKVVDMLNSDRIRELPPDVKRASVLMALDAAGTSPDDLLRDAERRQQALNSYEAGQQQKLQEFEARKAQENTKIQAEMDRVVAHYAERIQQNHEHVAREKDALRNWQMAKQHESQRIAEVIDLCAKQPAPTSRQPASAAAVSAGSEVPEEPRLVAKASAGR